MCKALGSALPLWRAHQPDTGQRPTGCPHHPSDGQNGKLNELPKLPLALFPLGLPRKRTPHREEYRSRPLCISFRIRYDHHIRAEQNPPAVDLPTQRAARRTRLRRPERIARAHRPTSLSRREATAWAWRSRETLPQPMKTESNPCSACLSGSIRHTAR